MFTPFLVYTYVIHTNIALRVTIARLYTFPHKFQASFRCIPTIYTAYVCYNSWNFTGISHGCLAQTCLDDEHISKYSTGIPTYYHEDGMPRYISHTLSYHCMMVP